MPQPRLDEDLLNRSGSRRELATPALVLDLDVLEANITAMSAWARRTGIALRPHAKTHKSAAIGHLQMQAGALGLCCAKLAEAEALAAAGLDRFLLTSPVIGARKLERLVRLAARCTELMVVVDDTTASARWAPRPRRPTAPSACSSTSTSASSAPASPTPSGPLLSPS